jgi:hypothetical protein
MIKRWLKRSNRTFETLNGGSSLPGSIEIRGISKKMQKTQNRFGGESNPLTFAPPYETGQ